MRLSGYLGFGSSHINIGDISAGAIKSFIDCLYPVFGGEAGCSADHRIDVLTVAKAVRSVAAGTVVLKIRPRDRIIFASC